jgi:hypothetical protein
MTNSVDSNAEKWPFGEHKFHKINWFEGSDPNDLAFYEAFDPERARSLVRRIEFCYTPKHGSWLNIAENELSAMTRQCLSNRRIGNIETLQREISAWSTAVNASQRGVEWQMKITDARRKLKSVYPKIES